MLRDRSWLQTGVGPPGRRLTVHPMKLVIIKLFEVAARALFTVLVTFSLPLEEAGQFGLIATVINLFAFGLGWERHIDLQRRLVGSSKQVFDAGVIAALKLYTANALFLAPLFVLVALTLVQLEVGLALLATAIVVSELLANQLYNVTLVQHRYIPVLLSVLLKNAALLGVTTWFALANPEDMTFERVLYVWFSLSLAGTLVLVTQWWWRARPLDRDVELPIDPAVGAQRKASMTHFLIGLMGILSLQADRFVIGALLPLETVGVFFRHALLVSLAYQLFNIGSHNRLLPRVFETAKTQPVSSLVPIVVREWLLLTVLVGIGFATALGLDALTGRIFSERFSLDPLLAAILLLGVVIRTGADFCAMLCNATHHEREIFRSQILAFSVGTVAMILLTFRCGLYGAAAGGTAAALFYLIVISRRFAKTKDTA